LIFIDAASIILAHISTSVNKKIFISRKHSFWYVLCAFKRRSTKDCNPVKAISTFVHINIHWGEFCGPVERTEIDLPLYHSGAEKEIAVYKYYIQLRGYKPFTLYKCVETKQWLDNREIHASISNHVIYYAKIFIDQFECKNDL